ncbi:MAG: PEP-CTERM sorting domain-containing protein [Phycisphaerae bacterium]|nr:PEP-CTERM sorting domain-containing protein [Phycisphaerae bacterium]
MKRAAGLVIVAAVLAIPMASAQADWVVGADASFYADLARANAFNFGGYAVPIGAFNAPGNAGTLGHVYGSVRPGNPLFGYFGAQWDGPVEVYTLSLTQLVDAGRQRPDVIYLYTDTNPENYIEINLAALWGDGTTIQGKEQVIDLTAFNGGKPILANNSYLLMAVQTMHPGGNDSNFGVLSYGFEAKVAGDLDVNLNRLPGSTATGTGSGGYAGLIDGRIHAIGDGNGIFWNRGNTDPNTVTVSYLEPQTIGSIGLGMAAGNADRDCPQWVDITATFANNSTATQRIHLTKEMVSYGRYTLPDGPFVDAVKLTLTMPPGAGDEEAMAANWWLNGRAADLNFGLTQFQAFAPIPEPATMTLLALGGLAMLRRRK